MVYFDLFDMFDSVFGGVHDACDQDNPWFSMGAFKIEREDIGKTVVFCSVCSHKVVLGSGAVSLRCPNPNCYGILQFIDITEELFEDDETRGA
jgi:hypothetical protein